MFKSAFIALTLVAASIGTAFAASIGTGQVNVRGITLGQDLSSLPACLSAANVKPGVPCLGESTSIAGVRGYYLVRGLPSDGARNIALVQAGPANKILSIRTTVSHAALVAMSDPGVNLPSDWATDSYAVHVKFDREGAQDHNIFVVEALNVSPDDKSYTGAVAVKEALIVR